MLFLHELNVIMKNIWIINQYITTPELNGDNHRHYSIGKELEKQGYDVTLITSSFSHVPKRKYKMSSLFKVLNTDIRTLIVKGISYKKTEGLGRIINMVIFFFLLYFIPKKKLPKPDVIIISSISLLPILNISFFRRRFKNCKIILEIRDVWPLSLIELGGYSPNNKFIKFLAWVEKKGYKDADHIVSLLRNVDKHIESILETKDFKYSWITNGYNLDDNVDNAEVIELPEEVENKIPKNKFVIGYAGSLGNANAMEYVVTSMNQFKDAKDICMCIIGSGDKKEKLKKISSGNENVIYLDSIPKKMVQTFLSKMDVLYLSYKKLPIYRLGISANKIFDYMYAAKPVIMSADVENDPITLSEGGLVISAEDTEAIQEAILKIKNMNEKDRKTIGNNGKNYLLNHFTYAKLTSKYIAVIKSLS